MGNETATLEVDDSLDCSFACVKDIECFSYNFGSPGSMERPRKLRAEQFDKGMGSSEFQKKTRIWLLRNG